jgi:hypothetical protein
VLPPLSLAAITELARDRSVDPVRLHRVTGGNAFFVVEMLDHTGDDLPMTVRDARRARPSSLNHSHQPRGTDDAPSRRATPHR